MIKIIIAFLVFFAAFFFGIKLIANLTNRELLTLTKYLVYSTICTIITVSVLVSIVILF